MFRPVFDLNLAWPLCGVATNSPWHQRHITNHLKFLWLRETIWTCWRTLVSHHRAVTPRLKLSQMQIDESSASISFSGIIEAFGLELQGRVVKSYRWVVTTHLSPWITPWGKSSITLRDLSYYVDTKKKVLFRYVITLVLNFFSNFFCSKNSS